jgi:hypothetical protein
MTVSAILSEKKHSVPFFKIFYKHEFLIPVGITGMLPDTRAPHTHTLSLSNDEKVTSAERRTTQGIKPRLKFTYM